MVMIRQDQLDEFSRVARSNFETEMIAHSREFAPKLSEILGEDQLRHAVNRSIDRAEGHGFTDRGPVRLFIEMMFLFGSGFDNDPQYSWVGRVLAGKCAQMDRAEQLYLLILDYQESVSGQDAEHTRTALRGLLEMAREPLALNEAGFASGMLKEMHRVFPKKAAYVGESGLRTLIEEGRGAGKSLDFHSIRGQTLLVVLMFAFGHECLSDPLYPWISRTLRDEKLTAPAARIERLERKSVTWLEHVVASFSGDKA